MKISGRVMSTRPISLSRAAKLISRFAAVENGSSPSVSLYLQRASNAFNHLLQFHEKRSKPNNRSNSIQMEKHSDDNDGVAAPPKKKKHKRRQTSELDSENIQSENTAREREGEKENIAEAPLPKKKKQKRKTGEASGSQK